ncbi:hypothetical protein BDV95DRAFT_589520 [Massariosphaeria phaeospora]|uniref:Uncharacterized protein n=1 Tax=Massariosphaeria phaeospora TaxID=100035 RepID=A0A7C8INN1_9PLEO|nr:hypothetical protein BDV95DRAFT_589520 [Massariosphaeria phaeospora]
MPALVMLPPTAIISTSISAATKNQSIIRSDVLASITYSCESITPYVGRYWRSGDFVRRMSASDSLLATRPAFVRMRLGAIFFNHLTSVTLTRDCVNEYEIDVGGIAEHLKEDEVEDWAKEILRALGDDGALVSQDGS